MKPYYQHAGITIFNADCREMLPQLALDAAIVSDPPYGMKRHGLYQTGANSDTHPPGDKSARFGETVFGDDEPFDPSHLLGYGEVLLWGLNHFPQHLHKGTVLVWLKRYDTAFGSFLSDAELAWLNRGCGVYCRRDVSLQGESDVRLHPSQKPVGIMKWCVGMVKAETVIDPYCGSGTTLIAAKQLGRRAIGIEIDERYCEIAAKRLSQEVFDFGDVAPDAPTQCGAGPAADSLDREGVTRETGVREAEGCS
jgi:site-specific DNA-methyltransferase (adenine-specific)